MVVGSYVSIITLNVNWLNAPTKRHRLYRLKLRGWEKVFLANETHKKAGIAILISDKIDFKKKTVIRDQEDTT